VSNRRPSADLGRFFIGLFMAIAGVYLFTNQVRVGTFYWGWHYSMWGMEVTPFGITLLPFIIGVVMVFFDTHSRIGWALAGISIVAILVGIIASLQVYFESTTLYVALGILILMAGGLGLMMRALRSSQDGVTGEEKR
jgi:hypothetical protein